MPKFIGPYKILKAMNESLNVMLELPQEFKDRKINPTFHTNLVWPYIKNNDILFPKRDTKVFYDFGNDEDQEWFVEEILAHKWTNSNLELQVKCVTVLLEREVQQTEGYYWCGGARLQMRESIHTNSYIFVSYYVELSIVVTQCCLQS